MAQTTTTLTAEKPSSSSSSSSNYGTLVSASRASYASDHPPPPNSRNYANLCGFLINAIVTYAVGTLTGHGRFSGDNATDISGSLQTIVTPANFSFLIWFMIFLSQAIFTAFQMFAVFRSTPMVQNGVNLYYLLACLLQSSWVLAFYFDKITFSLILMILLLLSLISLLISQYHTPSQENFKREYWVFRFPFELYCGWLVAALLVNISVVLVHEGSSLSLQLTFGIISFSAFLALSFCLLFIPDEPNYVIPTVLAWASFGISKELKTPKPSISNSFGHETVSEMQNTATWISMVIVALIALRLGIVLIRKRMFR